MTDCACMGWPEAMVLASLLWAITVIVALWWVAMKIKAEDKNSG